MAALVAFTLILASVSSFFLLQRQNIEEKELERITERIASFINDVNSINAELETSITFTEGESEGELHIDGQIGGKSYSITMTSGCVLLKWEGFVAKGDFLEKIHVWSPEIPGPLTQSQIDAADRNITSWEVVSGTDIRVVREKISGLGFHTFSFRP